MHISWNFLDKRKATIKAIEAFHSMGFILENTDNEIATVRSRMVGAGSPRFDGMPRSHNNNAAEERMVKGIAEIDMLKERYRQAVEYMSWFKPAWEQLSEDERFTLESFYMDVDEGDANRMVQEELNISQSGAYNKKNQALDHLSLLLYGKA